MKNILKIDNTTYLIILLSFLCGQFKNIIILYLIIIFHEFGHYLFIKKYQHKIINITIYPFGGITKYQTLLNHNLKEEFIREVSFIDVIKKDTVLFLIWMGH